ncbi:threonine synthase [Longimicrobium sp.]|uniref:threonine synthase n=1 Tax=Longimicrobium sp. TaxID=2029185 RepID=UPI002C390A86|nr:threonine synthase [Longimicrobium sp.]HSU15845.1 threonine synthase [Longimicrobium sp.]
MRYISTRGQSDPVPLSAAVERGLAPDGGLYVPEAYPPIAPEALDGAETLAEVAERLLAPFFAGDVLAPALGAICREAFTVPVPLRDLRDRTAVLELFHGPTAAFKDVGARFLAALMSRLDGGDARPLTILVATSGDTGGAVAAAFHGRPGVEVAVLYPAGMVSPRQEKQLTAWGGNVRAFAVRGAFDDCQRLVKAAMADPALRAARRLSSANSINVGRLLPQMAYYAWAAREYVRRHGAEPGFVIPSGNLGNAAAALWARRAGLPIRQVVMATNANRAIAAFAAGGAWAAHPTVATLASAMDVGDPSNMERIFHLFGGHEPARAALCAEQVDDDEIRRVIREGESRWGTVWDPHTATAIAARERLGGSDWIVVATAHPAKFEAVVEPLVGHEIPIPPELQRLLGRPSHAEPLEPTLDAFRAALEGESEGR